VSDALYVLLILAGFLRTGLVPVIYELVRPHIRPHAWPLP
jgi:hypothetical protein